MPTGRPGGLQELAGNATLLYYMSEEAKEFHRGPAGEAEPNAGSSPGCHECGDRLGAFGGAEGGALGHHRLRGRHGGEERPGLPKGGRLGVGGGDAPPGRPGGRLRPPARVPRWYDRAEALIADPEVDAVYVATPPDSHADYALQVAAAGKPAYVEKPMARHTPECDWMIEAFARAGLPLFVAYYRRRLPRFLEVEKLLREGALGKLTGVRYVASAPRHRDDAGWRLDPAVAGGGHFLDVGSHVLDLLDYLLGPLTEVAGMADNLGGSCAVEDVVAMSFRVGARRARRGRLGFCERGDGGRGRALRHRGAADVLGLWKRSAAVGARGRRAPIERPNPPHVAQPLIQTVVDDLLGRGRCPSTGESARRTTRVMDTVLEGYYGGRSDEFWLRRRPTR